MVKSIVLVDGNLTETSYGYPKYLENPLAHVIVTAEADVFSPEPKPDGSLKNGIISYTIQGLLRQVSVGNITAIDTLFMSAGNGAGTLKPQHPAWNRIRDVGRRLAYNAQALNGLVQGALEILGALKMLINPPTLPNPFEFGAADVGGGHYDFDFGDKRRVDYVKALSNYNLHRELTVGLSDEQINLRKLTMALELVRQITIIDSLSRGNGIVISHAVRYPLYCALVEGTYKIEGIVDWADKFLSKPVTMTNLPRLPDWENVNIYIDDLYQNYINVPDAPAAEPAETNVEKYYDPWATEEKSVRVIKKKKILQPPGEKNLWESSWASSTSNTSLGSISSDVFKYDDVPHSVYKSGGRFTISFGSEAASDEFGGSVVAEQGER